MFYTHTVTKFTSFSPSIFRSTQIVVWTGRKYSTNVYKSVLKFTNFLQHQFAGSFRRKSFVVPSKGLSDSEYLKIAFETHPHWIFISCLVVYGIGCTYLLRTRNENAPSASFSASSSFSFDLKKSLLSNFFNFAKMQGIKGDVEQVIALGLEILKSADVQENPKNQLKVLLILTIKEMEQGNLTEASRFLQKIEDLFKKITPDAYDRKMFFSFKVLYHCYCSIKANSEESRIENLQQALALTEKEQLDSSPTDSLFLITSAFAYEAVGRLSEAQKIYLTVAKLLGYNSCVYGTVAYFRLGLLSLNTPQMLIADSITRLRTTYKYNFYPVPVKDREYFIALSYYLEARGNIKNCNWKQAEISAKHSFQIAKKYDFKELFIHLEAIPVAIKVHKLLQTFSNSQITVDILKDIVLKEKIMAYMSGNNRQKNVNSDWTKTLEKFSLIESPQFGYVDQLGYVLQAFLDENCHNENMVF
jgi:tetratricopeptide (TPR) repeat protein